MSSYEDPYTKTAARKKIRLNLVHCEDKLHGKHERKTVVTFDTKVMLYKEGCNMNDADGLKSFSWVLESEESTWRNGIKDSVTT